MKNFNSMSLVLLISSLGYGYSASQLKKEDCEVCYSTLEHFVETLTPEELNVPAKIESRFREYCKNTKGKENRFCYYLGGLETSATGILGEMSKPLSWKMPLIKICEKLKKKDNQICDLRYEKTIDFETVDFKKLKVRDLKNILSNWGEECDGCIEKSDFIKQITFFKPKYVREKVRKEVHEETREEL